ncbi:MAG: AAA domain-containing protein [Candidatus Altiarchaeota archaeon]|nr:AAA domain-containing protein [Candidatus Altiarchaeota archaeon]
MITSEVTRFLFNRVSEVVAQTRLSTKEKILELRLVLDSLFKELTKEEPQFFSSLYSRSVFIFDKNNVSPLLAGEVHGFRVLANKVVHENAFTPSEEDYLAAVKVVCLIISYFSKAPAPDELTKIYAGKPDLTLTRKPATDDEIIPSVKATVLGVGDIREVGDNSRRCNLFCDTDELGAVSISFWNKFSDIGGIIWKFATLRLFNLQKVPDTEDLYSTTKDSLVVLEPDFLVNATQVAECFHRDDANPLLYLLKKFVGFRVSEPIILGKIVNTCFDELLRNSNISFKEIFKDEIRQNTLPLTTLPLPTEEVVNSLRQRAHKQYDTLQTIVRCLEINSAVIEPTFLSDKYGLQGRLDVLLEYDNDGNRKNIIELKSGSAPGLHIGIWPNNLMQVSCYNLLLDSSFPNRTGGCNILYSKAGDEPLRNAPNIIQLKQDALMLRNRIVALEYELTNNTGESIQRINPDAFGTAPPFIKEDIAVFHSTLSAASDLEKKYFRVFVSFIAREQRIAKIGSGIDDANEGFASLWRKALSEKEASFSILSYLLLSGDNSDFENLSLVFKRSDKTLKVTNFRVGDIAVLYPIESDGSSKPLKHQILRGVIKEIDNDHVRLSLRDKQLNQAYFNQTGYWAIEHDFLEGSFNTLYQSLFDFLKAGSEKKDILLGLRKPEFTHIPLIKAEGLSEEQCRCLTSAVSARDYFLLQGPPGTGKTSVMLREMVRYLMDNTGEDVVLLAFTNRSVDEICDALKSIHDDIFFIRLGGKENTKHRENLLSVLIRDKSIPEVKELIVKTRIFVSTVSSFLSNRELMQLKKFSTAIVDEASQLLEPHLAGLLSKVERFILIGDEKQLPAVVTQKGRDTVVVDEDLRSAGIEDLRTSFFERLLKCCQKKGWSDAYEMLSCQGRMHRDVAKFPNQMFYLNKLKPLYGWQENTEQKFSSDSGDPIERMLAKSRILFIPSQRERQTKVHTQEANRVNLILHSIARVYGPDFSNETVGVITPYRAQIAEISSKLPQNLCELVTVDTVERFQGSEREIIIISFAVNYPQQLQRLQALTPDGVVDRKLNVALTRAKKHLILLGYPDILAHKTHFRQLIEFIKTKNGYVSEEIEHIPQQRPL